MTDKVECEWRPELHHGRQCPIHKGGSSIFDDNSPQGFLYSQKIKNQIYDKEGNKVSNKDYEEYLERIYLDIKPENAYLLDKYCDKIFLDKKESCVIGTSVYLDPEAFKEWHPEYDKRFSGEIIFHEQGHQIDKKLAAKLNNLPADYETVVRRYEGWSSPLNHATACYVSEATGMTLQKTLEKEFKKIKEIDIQEMLTEIDDYEDEILRKEGLDVKEYRDYKAQMRAMDYNADYRAMYDEFKSKYPRDYNALARRKFIRDFTPISDVISSRYYQTTEYGTRNHGLGIGHSETYYRERKAYGLGTEFFANVFAAETAGQTQVLETTRAYFPETMKVYDELIRKMREVE